MAMTNIRSFCPQGKKADLKLHTILKSKADIHIIVDSRLDEAGVKTWKKYQKQAISKFHIFGNFSKDRGVTILAKKSIGVTIKNIEKIDEKNTVLFQMSTTSGTDTDVCAVYAPSDVDSPKFFETAVDRVNSKGTPNRLIIGDFNTTMSKDLDQLNYDTDPHAKCREFLTGLEHNQLYYDVFRTMYPGKKAFTWRERDGNRRARLDVAMASPSLYSHIKDITHSAHRFSATDHSTLLLTFDFDKSESGPGIFRCQPSLHTNPDYQSKVRDQIRLAIYECMATMGISDHIGKAVILKRQALECEITALKKDPAKVNELSNHELQLALYLSCEPTIEELINKQMTVSNATLHEYILMKLKEMTLAYSKKLKKSTRKEQIRLENELTTLSTMSSGTNL